MPVSSDDLAHLILEGLAELRRKVQERVRESNATTEREVMSAADAAGRVVTVASRHIQDLQKLISLVQDQQAASFDHSSSADARLKEISTRVEMQQSSARQAIAQAEKIAEVARTVQKLANRANILSLNARIEAARAGRGAEGFAVIANEMKQLSASINVANVSIGGLAGDLHSSLPGLAEQAGEIRQLSGRLSSELTENLTAIRDRASSLNSEVSRALSGSDQALEEIMRASQDVLSHLQFQDTVAQGLGRMDGWLHDAEVRSAQALGADDRIGDLPPPMHKELGGHKAVDNAGAGQVSLFGESDPSESGGGPRAPAGRAGDVLFFGDD